MLADAQEHAREVRESLSVWLTPIEFKAVVEDARARLGPHVIFRNPAWSFWRDAWTIGRFADLIHAEAV
ncbi:hypothetical protein SAMN05216360_10529 [Methylobacterium phyllostachyos]|uniref:Uncharacterized protein n=1 Tax=Methylobacterium phyllostachyos TaxID=582672 RepID=A0A1G9XTT4_9HYPH|nr:hypothetical protein [Methylobacterium phyllostachyos]SDN00150.1 hypothetical protein SAMN05216360_10529 [Methylobacterium phyllostachyos]